MISKFYLLLIVTGYTPVSRLETGLVTLGSRINGEVLISGGWNMR